MRSSASLRAGAAALLLLLGLAAGACEKAPAGAVDVTVIGESLELADPASGAVSTPEAVLLGSVAQGLVRFDARGQIVPGLAERWNVSDDGLSYIFRLSSGEWPNGDEITARQVARILNSHVASRSSNPLKDTLGAVDEIVAMTDRVIEIRLSAPRPNLLQVLAQPEFAILREGEGTGPFEIAGEPGENGLLLARDVPVPDEEIEEREEVRLQVAAADEAIRQFKSGATDLVLGGTFVDLPLVRAAEVPDGTLRFDPASGLFGLVPARENGPLADEELRRLLSQAIDRDALIAAFQVPGLLPRATLLEPGLDGMPDPVPPEWTATPIAQRRPALAAAADELFAEEEERPVLAIELPEGPGAEILLNRLRQDWAVLGIGVERAGPDQPADLELVDIVAPSTSAAWFLRRFRCEDTPICSEDADTLLDAARATPVAAQHSALLLEAARRMDEAQVFIPLTAPIRWSLVSERVTGIAGNRFARHPLTGLGETLNPERGE